MPWIFSRSFWVTATRTVITSAAGPVISTCTQAGRQAHVCHHSRATTPPVKEMMAAKSSQAQASTYLDDRPLDPLAGELATPCPDEVGTDLIEHLLHILRV